MAEKKKKELIHHYNQSMQSDNANSNSMANNPIGGGSAQAVSAQNQGIGNGNPMDLDIPNVGGGERQLYAQPSSPGDVAPIMAPGSGGESQGKSLDQNAIDRQLAQIEEAKRITSIRGNKGTQAEQDAWGSSNKARKELDRLGYTGHNEGAYASGTSYGDLMNQNLEGEDRDRFAQQQLDRILGAKSGVGKGNDQQHFNDSNSARDILDAMGLSDMHQDGHLRSGSSFGDAQGGILKDGIKENIGNQSDAQIKEQSAIINQNAENEIVNIQKAYDSAVAQGQLSQEEANRQFEENKEAIYQQAYRDTQSTELSASSRGIGNSQQLLGLMAGDNARKNSNVGDARQQRDTRINDIRSRIDEISLHRDLDVSNIESSRDSQLLQSKSAIDANRYGQMNQMDMGELQDFRQHQNQKELQQGGFDHESNMMDKNQEFTQDNMEVTHGYDLEKMTKSERHDFGMMAKEHGYDIEKMTKSEMHEVDMLNRNQVNTVNNMNRQQEHTLQQFATTHGYDLEKMSVSQKYELIQMQANYGYNSKLSDQGYRQDSKLSNQGFRQDSSLSNQGFRQDSSLSHQGYRQNSSLSSQDYTQNSWLSNQGYTQDSNLSAQGHRQNTSLAGTNYGYSRDLAGQDHSNMMIRANEDAERSATAERDAYQHAVNRSLKGVTPGTKEYKILEGEGKRESQQIYDNIHSETLHAYDMGVVVDGNTVPHPGKKPKRSMFDSAQKNKRDIAKWERDKKAYEDAEKEVNKFMSTGRR